MDETCAEMKFSCKKINIKNKDILPVHHILFVPSLKRGSVSLNDVVHTACSMAFAWGADSDVDIFCCDGRDELVTPTAPSLDQVSFAVCLQPWGTACTEKFNTAKP